MWAIVIYFLLGCISGFNAAYLDEETIVVNTATTKNVILACPVGETTFVAWIRDGNEQLGFSNKYTFPTLNEVEILDVDKSDEGKYECLLPGDQKITIKVYTVMVESQPITPAPDGEAPMWTVLPDPNTVVDNNKGLQVLACRAIGDPKPYVTAYKLNEDGSLGKQLKKAGLVLRNPDMSDQGKYVCLAHNRVGKKRHEFSVHVKMHGGVSEWAEWNACNVACGYGRRNRTRTCTNPVPSNGGRFCRDKLIEVTGCKERSCTAPRLMKFGFDWTSGDLVLECIAQGLPKPDILWRYNGRDIPKYIKSNTEKMVMPKAKARRGEYSCMIKNRRGFMTMFINVV